MLRQRLPFADAESGTDRGGRVAVRHGPADRRNPASSGDKFDIVATANAADALSRIDNRDAIGAIEIGDTVTAHIATGAGASTVSVVSSLAHSVAEQTGQQVTVIDSAPVTARDSSTVGLFYFLIVCTLGAT